MPKLVFHAQVPAGGKSTFWVGQRQSLGFILAVASADVYWGAFISFGGQQQRATRRLLTGTNCRGSSWTTIDERETLLAVRRYTAAS